MCDIHETMYAAAVHSHDVVLLWLLFYFGVWMGWRLEWMDGWMGWRLGLLQMIWISQWTRQYCFCILYHRKHRMRTIMQCFSSQSHIFRLVQVLVQSCPLKSRFTSIRYHGIHVYTTRQCHSEIDFDGTILILPHLLRPLEAVICECIAHAGSYARHPARIVEASSALASKNRRVGKKPSAVRSYGKPVLCMPDSSRYSLGVLLLGFRMGCQTRTTLGVGKIRISNVVG